VSNPFGGIDIANTGLGFNKFWIDTIAQNVANVNTVTTPGQEPFRARMVVAMPLSDDTPTGGGVYVSAVLEQEGDPVLVDDPTNPLADETGYVAEAVVDLSGQMGDLIIASRAYQANMSVFSQSRDALEAATTLGRR
jgi:flagellar basal-body rod protein FlgC